MGSAPEPRQSVSCTGLRHVGAARGRLTIGGQVPLVGGEIRLKTDDEIRDAMATHHIEGGPEAIPPFGDLLCDPQVYTSHALVEAQRITFHAGTHQNVVCLGSEDLEWVVHPECHRFL